MNAHSALKTAHVGVSLSESEASIAAPFTYSRPNIGCVPLLLCEGRSSLITSFQLFRFMAMYSMIQFTATILLYFSQSNFGNWQFLMQDLVVVFPLTLFMGATRASHTLGVKRPSGNLLSARNVLSVLAHIATCCAFQVYVHATVSLQPGYVNLATSEEGPRTWETTSMYYFVLFQYITMAALFSLGRPWKRFVLTNFKFAVWTAVALAAAVVSLLLSTDLGPSGANVFLYRDDVPLTWEWRVRLLALVALNVAANAALELAVTPALLRALASWRASATYVSSAATDSKSALLLAVTSANGADGSSGALGRGLGLGLGSVFGTGRSIRDGGKVYHEMRADFERGWLHKNPI